MICSGERVCWQTRYWATNMSTPAPFHHNALPIIGRMSPNKSKSQRREDGVNGKCDEFALT